jgi:hypothetical protein
MSRIISVDMRSRWLLFSGTLRQTRCWMVLPMARSQLQTVRVGPFVTDGGRAEMVRLGEVEAIGERRSASAALSSCIGAPLRTRRARVEISMAEASQWGMSDGHHAGNRPMLQHCSLNGFA